MYKVIAYPTIGRPWTACSGSLAFCRAFLAQHGAQHPDLTFRLWDDRGREVTP
jgi:hypothetical protein